MNVLRELRARAHVRPEQAPQGATAEDSDVVAGLKWTGGVRPWNDHGDREVGLAEQQFSFE